MSVSPLYVSILVLFALCFLFRSCCCFVSCIAIGQCKKTFFPAILVFCHVGLNVVYSFSFMVLFVFVFLVLFGSILNN